MRNEIKNMYTKYKLKDNINFEHYFDQIKQKMFFILAYFFKQTYKYSKRD